jgi:RecA/RadA recombinase
MDSKLDFIRTPSPFLQIVTGGGIRFSTLAEFWGAPKAGKSTFCYQSAGNFLTDFGNKAELKIIDSESSFDNVRMSYTFGLDSKDKRIETVGVSYIEQGMKVIEDWLVALAPDKYLLVIWDTLSSCPTKASFQTTRDAKDFDKLTMYSGGQGDRAKTIKHYGRGLMSALYGKNACLFFPTQVFSSLSPYGAKEQSGDGSAFKHNIHYSFHFSRWSPSKIKDELSYDMSDEVITPFTIANISLTKSRFSPEFKDSPLFVNNQAGGIIDSRKSLFLHAKTTDRILKSKGRYYYKFTDEKDVKKREPDPEITGKYWDDLIEDNEIYSYLTKNLLLETRRNYPIINRVYEVQGYPKLATYFPNEKLESDDEKKSKQEANNVFDLESFLSINKVEDYGTEPVSNIKSNKTSKKL